MMKSIKTETETSDGGGGGGGGKQNGSKGGGGGSYGYGGYLETSKAERAMWLMKCPPLVSRSLSASPSSDPSRPVAKVIVSIDPLNNSDDSPPQFTMELAATEAGNIPRCFAMDMSKDFIPMSVFSDTPQGKYLSLLELIELAWDG
ncbi:hypothetical protein PIB30_039391 [Stylosanthes scabra]|uniref:Uncharacterized protein n=1 Tax=Stylosanthes scabra TaxID=79078 RepID=A0ABU6YCP8_9FABA|nr:hypothetical protein [Stylosanthes scabra]